MKKTFLFAVLLMLTAGLCACALADDWTCPQCGRENREDMNFCGNCRTERPAEYCPVTSAMINAWVCSACGHVCPEEDHFCTKCGADHYAADPKAVLTARPVLDEVLMPPVSVRRISCSHNNDSTTIDYTASVEGKHIFWTEDQTRDFSGRMRLYDGK